MHGKMLVTILVTLALGITPGWSSVVRPGPDFQNHRSLSQIERSLRRVPAHISEFTPIAEPMALPRCGDVRPPEALATPDPLLGLTDEEMRVRVSFIVGADGRVHSPFILDSGGAREDQVVLRAIRRWRYRPALCNGVPTESEARVQFKLR